MKRGQLEEAIQLYTQAIQKDPSNHVLYSNRSAAYMKQEKYNEALEDANATIKIKPDWAKVICMNDCHGNWYMLHIHTHNTLHANIPTVTHCTLT